MNVLVAEDDYATRQLMRKLVSYYGECVVAGDGQEALDAYRLAWERFRPFDLVMLDVQMRKLDGLKALKAIRQYERAARLEGRRATKVLMTTAKSDATTILRAYYRCGASGYLVKPLSRPHLDAEINRLGMLPQDLSQRN